MPDHDLKKKLWALHIGGEVMAKLLQNKLEIEKTIDGFDVLVGGAGYYVTLDHMLRHHLRTRDPVLEELIPMLPTVAALSGWLRHIPCHKVTEEEFEFLTKLGHIL